MHYGWTERPINSLSLAPDVNGWLAHSRHPRILHVFDHACNLINERREVLSIVTPQIGNGPFNLVIPRLRKSIERLPNRDKSWQTSEVFFNHLNVESPVSIRDNQLIVGNLIISTASAKLWNPCPDWEVLHAKRESIRNQLTQLRITSYKRCGLDTCTCVRCKCMPFAKTAQGYSTTSINSKLPIANCPSSHSLLSAFTNADLASSLTAAKQLAGLGQGLTPAGDDFLLGAIYAAWIIHPPEIAGMLANAIAATAAPLTTSLSAAWLRSAGKGEAGILWHRFFDVLISANPARIQEAMDKILAVGETSGADAMAGFIGLFMCWGEHCSNLWEYNQT